MKLVENTLSKNVSKITTRLKIFVASFYCYLNYDKKKDFVVDFDNVWKWLGFTRNEFT